MARWTFSVMAVALLAALVWGAWWQAGWQSDDYASGTAQVRIGRGQISFALMRYDRRRIESPAGSTYGGFLYRRHDRGMHWWPTYEVWRAPGARHRIVRIPIWMPLVLFASTAGFCWRRHVRRRRRDRIIKAGGCPHCGYDLRGLAAHGETQGEGTKPRAVCPECGK